MSEILVVKLGGTTIADQSQVLSEVAAVARRRPVVLVHGGGKRITEWLERLGVPSRFEGGLRVTDAQSLEVAAAVLRGVVNSELVAGLRDLGVDAVGLSGVDGGLLVSERIPHLRFEVGRVRGPLFWITREPCGGGAVRRIISHRDTEDQRNLTISLGPLSPCLCVSA